MNKEKKEHTQNKDGSKIQELETKIIEMENNWKRALADYQNQQKRFNEEKEEIRKRSNEILLLNLLPVVDNMEMLLQHSEDMGFKMITKELQKILRESGLEEVETENKDFDLSKMEAIDSSEGEENKVIETKIKGYLLNGKLIRPAKVVVGKKLKEEQK